MSTSTNDPVTLAPQNMLVPAGITIKEVKYTQQELDFRGDLMQRLMLARFEREQNHPELDGMTYLEYYESNRKKDLSYLAPKKNKQDVRIVTGTTREKDTTLLSTMLNMNVEGSIQAFDKEDMFVAGLGTEMSDLVKKSRQIEDWEKKRLLIYREMISQGDVFVEEIFREEFQNIPVTDLHWDPNLNAVAELSFKERLVKVFAGCESRMVNGKKVYLGSVRIPYVEDQDFVAVLNIYSRGKAKQIYGSWERWDYVPFNITNATVLYPEDGKTYRDWNLITVPYDKVAEIKIYDKARNRFMIMLNGVLMLPINYPLTAISPNGDIPMSQGKLEPISDFAYSKSQPSKTKIDQEVLDEVTRLMIEAFRTTRKPPMGNASKKVYSSSIYQAGRITSDIKEGDLFPLVPPTPLSNAEFSFYNIIKQQINEKSVNDIYSGDSQQGDQTATEVIQQKQQQALKLGAQMDSLINFERRMTWVRLQNVLHNWLTPVETTIDDIKKGIKQSYQGLSLNTTLENGENGVKVFRFDAHTNYPDKHTQLSEEKKLTKKNGVETRITYMDPELLRSLKYRWYILIVPTPKSDDQLAQMLFIQNIKSAIEIFGPDALNLDYLKQRFSINIKEDYNKFFKKEDMLTMIKNMRQQNGGGMGKPATPGMSTGTMSSTKQLRPAVVQQ